MPSDRRVFGTSGEELAAQYLEGKGLRVLRKQERTPFGEIDLVCLDGPMLAFVEVKTRRTAEYGPPQAAITRSKFRHMAAAAQAYLGARGLLGRPWRLDVVAVDWTIQEDPHIIHFPAIDSPATF